MRGFFIKKNLLLITIFAVSCSSTSQIIKTTPNNPTGYTFEFNIQQVGDVIRKEFLNKPGYRYMLLDFPEKESIYYDRVKDLFSTKGNSNDFYLHNFGDRIGESKIYFSSKTFKSSEPTRDKVKKGDPLDYYAEFHLHLTLIDSTHTKVAIFTINPMVVTGEKLLPSFPHFGANPKYKSVPPSTIEEYEILLKIGKGLGVEDTMPKLMMP